MAVTAKVLLEGKSIEVAQTTQYTSPVDGKGTIIDKVAGTNTGGAAKKISIYIVPFGGAAADANLVAKDVSIGSASSYTFPELSGFVMAAGSFISTNSTGNPFINLRITGREIT